MHGFYKVLGIQTSLRAVWQALYPLGTPSSPLLLFFCKTGSQADNPPASAFHVLGF